MSLWDERISYLSEVTEEEGVRNTARCLCALGRQCVHMCVHLICQSEPGTKITTVAKTGSKSRDSATTQNTHANGSLETIKKVN